jgi:mono/diheme cytochrome c family protein
MCLPSSIVAQQGEEVTTLSALRPHCRTWRGKMLLRISVLSIACLLTFSSIGTGQQKTIKHVPIRQTSPASGQEMFTQYCAACHGRDAKGHGPAASALKVPPPDLTVLAQHNGGKFPGTHVASVLQFGSNMPAHGTREMPIWGPLLQSLKRTDDAQAKQRIANLTDYINSLQVK